MERANPRQDKKKADRAYLLQKLVDELIPLSTYMTGIGILKIQMLIIIL